MTYIGDRESWADLPNLESSRDSEDSDPSALENYVDHVVVEGPIYAWAIQGGTQLVRVHHYTEQGLSFQLWPSALTLSRFAELENDRRRDIWKGKRVVELGCGTGLVGLVFAALGADVLLTDKKTPLGMVRENVQLNADLIQRAGGRADCGELVWGVTDVVSLGPHWQAPDFVVAADVVYMQELFQPLLATLSSLGGPPCISPSLATRVSGLSACESWDV
eukprot:jgi/Botrbrau1/10461/Bobra.0133s0068.2